MPDLVVSGINKGYNIGDDVTYSGTVSGALEGALLGVPCIAVSLARTTGDYDFGPRGGGRGDDRRDRAARAGSRRARFSASTCRRGSRKGSG